MKIAPLPLVAGGLLAAACCLAALPLAADDWPTWRLDSSRSADYEGPLPESLHLQWVRQLPPLQPAYQNPRLQFDASYEPVVAEGRLYFGSSRDDSVTALDAASGQQLWKVHTEGPVRLAPVVWQQQVYFGSDEGHLYCVDAASGQLQWRFRAVPSGRMALGNGRLTSLWPVRGGPVIDDGVLYFAAGVWSFEGIFIYALDAASGEVQWVNDRTGHLYGQHPHDAEAFGGLTPQGYLLVQGDDLVVPCGTALPARLDRHTGQLKSFALPKQGRQPGGWFTAAARAQRRGQAPPDDSPQLLLDTAVNRDRHEGGWHTGPGDENVRRAITINGQQRSFDDPIDGVEGTISSMLVANGRLYVVTLQGGLYCFADQQVEPQRYAAPDVGATEAADQAARAAAAMLEAAGASAGYAVLLGAGDGWLIDALVAASDLHLIVAEPDAERCAALRRRLDAGGLLGWRVAVHQADPHDLQTPPYLATLVAAEDAESAGLARLIDVASGAPSDDAAALLARWFDSLRPYGGTLCLPLSDDQHAVLATVVERAELADAQWRRTASGLSVLSRSGALPGATDYVAGWTSQDQRVKAPLGVLWFDDKLAHFKRAPQPMIVDGVMISYDKDWKGWVDGDRPPYSLVPPTYSDIYTGRVFSPEEASQVADSLPSRDIEETQPNQYRPPSQADPWKPAPPLIGQRINPLTGLSEARAIPKSYGCDGGVDYGHLYTLRSGTAAFYDKRLESGTIHISGPRSGCTNSIIPAGGLLNVPYFFQGCTCSYPLPVGLALVPLPQEHEQWSVWGPGDAESIQRVGINFGAPGARMTDDGTLWLEHPSAGGPAPELQLTTEPQSLDTFYRHSVFIEAGRGWPWVAASGASAVTAVQLAGVRPGRYNVRLYFAETEEVAPGERVFDVAIGGQQVLQGFDVAEQAGGRMQSVVRQFDAIELDGALKVSLTPRRGQPILSGIELIADGLPRDPPPQRQRD